MPSGGVDTIEEGVENVDETAEAADVDLPRGMRRPVPGPETLEGNDTEAVRRLEYDASFPERASLDGVGEANRLVLPSLYCDDGRDSGELTEPDR